jgi:hypothetical protein
MDQTVRWISSAAWLPHYVNFKTHPRLAEDQSFHQDLADPLFLTYTHPTDSHYIESACSLELHGDVDLDRVENALSFTLKIVTTVKAIL